MGTIKNDRLDFERLLNGIDPAHDMGEDPAVRTPAATIPTIPAATVDNPSAAEIMQANVFEYDLDGAKKGIRKKCKKTIMNIVNHVLPVDVIDLDYIKDKIEQDIEILAMLYVQVEINTIMQKTIYESVKKGQVIPRMFEVFNQMTEKILAINKQIVDTEQRIRKTYLDLKFEAREKMSDDLAIGDSHRASSGNMIAGPDGDGVAKKGVIVSSTKDLINNVKNGKFKKIKEAYYEVKEQ